MDSSSGLFDSVHNSSLALSQQSYQALLARGVKNASKLSRRQRNALYKRSRYLASLPEDAREFHKNNPHAEGLPRAYTIRFTDLINDKHHPDSVALNSATISLGQLGKTTGFHLNGEQIDSSKVSYAAPTKTYTFSTKVTPQNAVQPVDVAGVLNFTAAQPSGTLNVGARTFNVVLDPKATWFDVKISTNSKAYFSTGKQGALIYKKADFDKATWKDTKFIFGYDNKNIGDDLQPNWVLQNYFLDTSSSPEAEFDLLGENYSTNYTCTLGPADGKPGSNMLTKVTTTIPKPPKNRAALGIETVFPKTWNVQFSEFGDSFYGAYQTESGTVYGVKGEMRMDDVSMFSMLSRPTSALPAVDTLAFLHDDKHSVSNGHAAEKPQQLSVVSAKAATADPALRVNELLGMDVMVPDQTDPSGYRDSVAQLAMQDFHSLIVYFMDEDLRSTFIQATQVQLPDYLLQIAQDSPDNSTFYKKLQVPLITTTLAHGTMDEAKFCNGMRADMKLKTIPSTDPVYQSHSAKLYRYHFLSKFPAMQKFLNDQRNVDHKSDIDKFVTSMKTKLKAKADPISSDNPNYATDLKAAQDEIDVLGTWAKDRNLYWALQLLYWTQNSSLPNWFSQYTTGSNTGALTMNLKKLNAIFGVLENNAKNTTPNGKNFMQAFNQDVRLFQMTSIVPLLIDAQGVSSDLDTITKECLDEYIKHYSNSPDEKHIDAIKAAQQLYSDADLRRKFFLPWVLASRLAGSTGAWNNIATLYEKTVRDAKWFRILNNGSKLLNMASSAMVAGFIIMAFIPTMRDKMTTAQKASWGISMAGLLAMIVVRIVQGVVRFVYFFQDISGFSNSLKCILGFEGIIDEIQNSANRIENGFARFFARTTKQTVELGQMDSALIRAGEQGEFSLVERAIGRNMAEVMGTVLGLVLSIVSIVLSAIEIHNEKDPLLKVMNIMMLCSAVIQLVAIVAGIVVGAMVGIETAGALAAGISALTMCAAWGGPLAIVFAIVGIVVFLVWYMKQDKRTPVQKFLDDKAGPAGLRMADSNQAPEYFQVVPAKENSPSLVGLGFSGPIATLSEAARSSGKSQVPNAAQGWFKLNVPGSNVITSNPLDYSTDMVWSMSVDADGKSFIYTVHYAPDQNDNTVLKGTMWYLATDDTGTNLVIRQMPDDDAKRKLVLSHYQWTVDITTKPATNGSAVISALVRISQGGRYMGQKYSYQTGKVDPSVILNNSVDSGPGTAFADVFLMSMQPGRPGVLSYNKAPLWQLLDTDTDKINYARFTPAGTASAGLTWSISPALPSGFELIKSGDDEGAIKQIAGKTPAIQAATEYTVTCQLPGKPDSAQSTKVTIEVDDHTNVVDPNM